MPTETDPRAGHLRRFFDAITQGIVCQDAAGRVTYANEAALRLLGRSSADALDDVSTEPKWRTIRRDGSPCPADQHPSQVALRTGGIVREELGLYDPVDEIYRWVEVTAIPRMADGEAGAIEVYTTFDDGPERRRSEAERERLVHELEDAMANLKLLRGFLPICSSCKKIRNDAGYWQQLEVYVRDHSEAEFSHGLCPGCLVRLYPEFAQDDSSG